MAVNSVSLAESLRPWKQAGLQYLFFDAEPGAYATGLCAEMRSGVDAFSDHQSLSHAAPIHRSPASSSQAESATVSQVPKASAAALPNTSTLRSDAAPEAPSASSSGISGSMPRGLSPQPASSSETTSPLTVPTDEWRLLLDKLSSAPVLWTYPDLGLDMTGHANAERSALLRQLIAALGLPRGSSTFWPYRLSSASSAESAVQAACFALGFAKANPKAIILFGAQTPVDTGIAAGPGRPFTHFLYKGALTLLLPDINALLADAQLVQRAIAFLRAALSDLPALRN